MSQMKLGWWRARNGVEYKVDIKHEESQWPWWSSVSRTGWDAGGFWNKPQMETDHDLIEFLRPLEDLQPALNAAVKAAEDWVRRMEAQYHAAQKLANQACDDMNHARRELERLESECEVKP